MHTNHSADYIFKCIFLNENIWIPIKTSLKFVLKVWINNIPALVQIMAWRRLGDKPLSEPITVSLLTYICVTRPQWVNGCHYQNQWWFFANCTPGENSIKIHNYSYRKYISTCRIYNTNQCWRPFVRRMYCKHDTDWTWIAPASNQCRAIPIRMWNMWYALHMYA